MDLMASTQVLGNVGEFVGAIAVFATLLYLAIQVREAGRSAKFEAVQANRAERMAWFAGVRDSPYIIPILQKAQRGEPLSDEEQARLGMHLSASWALLYSEWVQREIASAGEYATKADAQMGWIVSDEVQMAWWKTFGEAIYPQPFVDYVRTLEPTDRRPSRYAM